METSGVISENEGHAPLLAWISAVDFLFTLAWLIAFIISQARTGPVQNVRGVIAVVLHRDNLYTFSYLNAAVVTVVTTLLFASLHESLRPAQAESSASASLRRMAWVFVPVYCAINLIVYLGQVTVVPQLLGRVAGDEYGMSAALLMEMFYQGLPGSAANTFNNLAYGLLGISSLMYGLLIWQRPATTRRPRLLRTSGLLLALNGLACLLGFIGLLAGSPVLGLGSIVGGVLFLLALPCLALGVI